MKRIYHTLLTLATALPYYLLYLLNPLEKVYNLILSFFIFLGIILILQLIFRKKDRDVKVTISWISASLIMIIAYFLI